jgi:hypothetical protein
LDTQHTGDCRTKLGDLDEIPGNLPGLLNIAGSLRKPVGLQMLLPTLEESASHPPDEVLPIAMLAEVAGPDQLKRLVQPAVGQGTLSLFDPEKQHGSGSNNRDATCLKYTSRKGSTVHE